MSNLLTGNLLGSNKLHASTTAEAEVTDAGTVEVVVTRVPTLGTTSRVIHEILLRIERPCPMFSS